jgi:8-oxo-dGTP pyrophosphatase MutT (NUDIX family)
MQPDPRLSDIDDCLYRVAARALVVQDQKVLLVKEYDVDRWWAVPGGGVDYGETIQTSLVRELQEELGVPAASISCDFEIAHYNIGKIVDGIPRMNIYFKVTVPADQITKTEHVEKWAWFTKEEFLAADTNPTYDKAELAKVIFSTPTSVMIV